mmetsp:Transcript_23991/g.78015  ORF Transcript_23991/g.78015 Transcript_23991/m.78015 type:complete len:248 (+) Transcript_23991:1374-2117(+)
MEEAHDVEQLAPLLALDGVEHVLRDPRVRVAEAGAHADGRLVGDFDGHLQQSDGELGVRLGGDPEPEVLVELLRLDEERLHLEQVVEAEVGVLEEHPLPLRRGRRHVLARDDLLSLPHRHTENLDLLLFAEVLDELGRVGARREEAHERAAVVALHPRRLHVERDGLDEALPECVGDEVLRRYERAVLAHSLDDTHALKLGNLLLVIRDASLLRRFLIVPLTPQAVVAVDGVLEVVEGAHRGERHAR